MNLEHRKDITSSIDEESTSALSKEAQRLQIAAARADVPDRTRIDPIPPWKPDPPCNWPFDPFCKPEDPPMPWDPKPKPKHPPKRNG